MTNVLREIEAALPPVLFRNHPSFKELTGESSRTYANRDSAGCGPKERVRVGRVVGYPKAALLDYLAQRLQVLPPKAQA